MLPTSVLMPPSETILRLCALLDQLIGAYLRERRGTPVGRYEAEVEALLMFNLGIRHVEGVQTLARQDLVLLPSAYHLARAALETCVRAAWLVDLPEPMQREGRWLQHLDEEIDALRRMGDRARQAGLKHDSLIRRTTSIRAFRDKVAKALCDTGTELPKGKPKFDQMMSSLGGVHLYSLYIESSQYAHGGHMATWLYRGDGLGIDKAPKERIKPGQWIIPLKMCWLALGTPGEAMLTRIKGSADFAHADLIEEFQVALTKLGQE